MSTHHKFIGYIRVSTDGQAVSGLGLEAQQAALLSYVGHVNGELLTVYTEAETGKGRKALTTRPELAKAVAACKKQHATLLIAKLDRLARNVAFVSSLMEDGFDFVAADMPQATKFMLQMHAVMAEWERDQISKRTKEALAAKKARGEKLGSPQNLVFARAAKTRASVEFAETLRAVVTPLVESGATLQAIADYLNLHKLKTTTGLDWSHANVKKLLNILVLQCKNSRSQIATSQ